MSTRPHNHLRAITVLAFFTLFIAGCSIEARLWWSPDGQTLAVLTPTGLVLSDSEGLLSGAACEGVKAAAWLPDGSGLVVSRETEHDTWDAAKARIPAEEAERIEAFASGIPDLAKALFKVTHADPGQLDALLKPLDPAAWEILEPAFNCAMQTHPEALRDALETHASAEVAKDLLADKPSFKVREIAVLPLEGKALGTPRPLIRSVLSLGAPVVSPKHGLVAFTAGTTLRIATLDASASLEVTDANLGPCAWTPDGLSLAFLTRLHRAVNEAEPVLAKLCLRTVAGADGKLLPTSGEAQLPAAVTLSTVAVCGSQRLAVLPDGRILFASMAVTFPATRDPAAHGRLFLLDPAQGENARPVPVPVDPAVWSGTLQHFAVSPDGKKAALVEPGRDSVAVVELATGKIEVVSPDRGHNCRTLPAWRSADELSFAALPEDKSKRPEVMHLRLGHPARAISKTWDPAVLQPLLEAPDEAPPSD